MEPTTTQNTGGVGIDLDPSRRPGVPREREPRPWPNTRYPPERMSARPSVPKHGRPNKPWPPVYGTAVPLRGVSGLIRRAAYRWPDHWMRHWMVLMFADRVDSMGSAALRLAKVAGPGAALGFLAVRALGFDRRR